MLKLVKKSTNKKLGNIASTYRSGRGNVFSTCPSSCPMKPEHSPGTPVLDGDYLEAVLVSVPRGGRSFTYTHFPRESIPLPRKDRLETTINISTDTVHEALASYKDGYPTVVVLSSDSTDKFDRVDGVSVVRCPAEYYENLTCSTCGGKDGPLCARSDRNFIVKFTAHGGSLKKVDDRNNDTSIEKGGCYGSGGPVHLQWKNTMNQPTHELNDGERLKAWVATLEPGSTVRHHVLGDLGLQV